MRDALGALGLAAMVGIAHAPSASAGAASDPVFATEYACEKEAGLGAALCRRAFAVAQAVYESATRSYPNRFGCYRAYGPCMPWPLHGGPAARFRPQMMGVRVTGRGDAVAAVPVLATGRTRLVVEARLLTAALPSAPVTAAVPRIDASLGPGGPPSDTAIAICRHIEATAMAAHLPPAFLARLLWQESSFRAHVVSPAGALGIAQFMPGTARERGLADPFDPMEAIRTSAALLADLNRRFGNLGLAAAAYNGGPARVTGWLKGQRDLAPETQSYVLGITGRTADAWAAAGADQAPDLPWQCLDLASRLTRRELKPQTASSASIGSPSPTMPSASSASAK